MPLFNEQKLGTLRKLDRLIQSVYFFPKNTQHYSPLQDNDVKEILIISFLLIGDTIMYMPAIRVLKKNFPEAKITLVCGPAVQTILKHQNIVDEFVLVNCPWISPFDTSFSNILNFIGGLKKINKKKYDLAIDFRGDWRNIFYMNFIRSERKVSFNFSGGEYMLTDVIKVNIKPDHLIDETFALLNAMGCSYTENDKIPHLNINESDHNYLEKFKFENNLSNKFIIGVHPGASLEERKWDENKYAALINRLSVYKGDCVFLLFEGPNEKNTISLIESALDKTKVKYLVVKKSLEDYLAILSICKLMICNDSGAAHVAAAYQIPEVVIFGKGDPKEVKPYSTSRLEIISHPLECKPCHLINCKFGTNLCMKMVTVDEVYQAAETLINEILQNVA